jgi:SpoVK/Ycf46/Vps4 family AAA+-type ATPase
MNNINISKRFRNELELHLIKNFSIKYSDHSPLILGIHGPAGEGKTFQCENIFKELSVKTYVISPGELESDTAGKPSESLKKKYKDASDYFSRNRKPCVLFINDLDLGIGHTTDIVQTTINTWLLIGDLMALADFPMEVDNKVTSRIPIVITGNDFSKLHPPLLRPGRTKLFEWVPTEEEKSIVIQNLFPVLSLKECSELLIRLKSKVKKEKSIYKNGLPVSFFSSVKSNIYNSLIQNFLDEFGFSRTFHFASTGSHKELSAENNYDLIYEHSIALIESGEISNHLI